MTKLLKFTSMYGDGKSVTYYRALDIADDELADEKNKESAQDLTDYQAACAAGRAGKVETKIEEVDA